MFKISYMVDDRKLGKSLRALDGLAVGMPEVVPLRGAVEVDGEVREAVEPAPQKAKRKKLNGKMGMPPKPFEETNGGKAYLFMRKKGFTKVGHAEITHALKAVGGATGSFGYARKYLMGRKLLLPNPDGKTYTLKATGE